MVLSIRGMDRTLYLKSIVYEYTLLLVSLAECCRCTDMYICVVLFCVY